MFDRTDFFVDRKIIDDALLNIPVDTFRFSLNEPTGNFFYDPWVLKREFQGTSWEVLYNSLPIESKGEARIIKLNGGECYISHSDLDDRYHLNLQGEKCFLIDLDTNKMYPQINDGYWYDFNSSCHHTAANFGNKIRYQLVIRKLLLKTNLIDPVNISITSSLNSDSARFLFDEFISQTLNYFNKNKFISNFKIVNSLCVNLDIEKNKLLDLNNLLPSGFKVE